MTKKIFFCYFFTFLFEFLRKENNLWSKQPLKDLCPIEAQDTNTRHTDFEMCGVTQSASFFEILLEIDNLPKQSFNLHSSSV